MRESIQSWGARQDTFARAAGLVLYKTQATEVIHLNKRSPSVGSVFSLAISFIYCVYAMWVANLCLISLWPFPSCSTSFYASWVCPLYLIFSLGLYSSTLFLYNVGLFSMFNFSLAIFFIYCLSIWKKEKMQMNLPPPLFFLPLWRKHWREQMEQVVTFPICFPGAYSFFSTNPQSQSKVSPQLNSENTHVSGTKKVLYYKTAGHSTGAHCKTCQRIVVHY